MLANRINILLLLSIILFVLNSCKKKSNGYNLQKFEISNHKLDSIVNKFTAEYEKNCSPKERKIIVLDLIYKDSIPQFWFTFLKKEELINSYIYYYNKRIVGYITRNNSDLILLSNINYKIEFENIFSGFIYPTKKNKIFDYINFPNNQYKNDSTEIGINDKVIIHNSWPEVALSIDYAYVIFEYRDKKFINIK